jgi:hypothetical protein
MGDLPDYTRQVTIRYEGGFLGLEELAVRLGFPGVWNLKGNIVLMEDFESELTEWTDLSSGGTSSAIRSSRHKFSGDWSVKLYRDALADAKAILYRDFHYPGASKYATFARFCWTSDMRKVRLAATFCNGTTEYQALIDYDLATTTLSVITTGYANHNVDTALDLTPDIYTWYPVLFTFDLATGYYDKLYLADKEYDISDVLFYSLTSPTPAKGEIVVAALPGDSTAFTTYVDDIIIAKNVP